MKINDRVVVVNPKSAYLGMEGTIDYIYESEWMDYSYPYSVVFSKDSQCQFDATEIEVVEVVQ